MRRSTSLTILLLASLFLANIIGLILGQTENRHRIDQQATIISNQQAEIVALKTISEQTKRTLDIVIAATDPAKTAAALNAFFVRLKQELGAVKVAVQGVSGGTRTVVVTRTVTKCVRPNGRPC